MAIGVVSTSKRRDVVTLWMKQLMNLHERQNSTKPAAAGWIGAVYALRAASRLDANREWGRLGDEIISHLEQAYLSVMGPEGHKQIDVGRKLLNTQKKPELPAINIPPAGARMGMTRPTGLGPMPLKTTTTRPGLGTSRLGLGRRPSVLSARSDIKKASPLKRTERKTSLDRRPRRTR